MRWIPIVFLCATTNALAGPVIQQPLTLFDVTTGQSYPFNNGGTLQQGAKYFVRAKANPQAKSVRFRVDANSWQAPQNNPPYDSNQMILPAGAHTISAQPWSKDNARGSAGSTVRVSFSVKPKPSPTATPSPTASTTPTLTPTPTATPQSPTPSPSLTPTTPSPSPTATPSSTATTTPTPTPTIQPTSTPTPTATPSPTATPTVAVTATWIATQGDQYNLFVGQQTHVYGPAIDAGSANEYALNLLPLTTYYFALSSRNQFGESVRSEETVYTTTNALKQRLKLSDTSQRLPFKVRKKK